VNAKFFEEQRRELVTAIRALAEQVAHEIGKYASRMDATFFRFRFQIRGVYGALIAVLWISTVGRSVLLFFNAACGREHRRRHGRSGFIYAPSTSRGHADERAFHLLLDALHRASADAAFTRDLAYTYAATQVRPDALFRRGIDPRPAELHALCDRALKASVDALPEFSAVPGRCQRNWWLLHTKQYISVFRGTGRV
jgi:hypothetical protein